MIVTPFLIEVVILKKIIIGIFICLLIFNISVHPSFASSSSPEIIGRTGNNFYVKNPAFGTPQLLVPRANYQTGVTSLGPKNVLGFFVSLFMSTPTGQDLLSQGSKSVNDFANMAGQPIQAMSDAEKVAFQTIYDGAKTGGNKALDLSSSLYTSFSTSLRNAFVSANKFSGTVTDSNNVTTFKGINVSGLKLPSGYTFYHVLGSVTYLDGGRNRTDVWSIMHRDDIGAYGVINCYYYDGKFFSWTTNYDYNNTQLGKALSDGLNIYLGALAAHNNSGQSNVYSPVNENPSYVDSSNNRFKVPTFPSDDVTPAIVSAPDTGKKYWEIPNPYSDGQVKNDYIPVDDPTAKAISDVIVINDKGYQVFPDGTLSKDVVTGEVPHDFAEPVDKPASADWWKWLIDSLVTIPDRVITGIKDLFIPKESITDLYLPLKDQVGQKFNSPSDFGFLIPDIKNSDCPPDIKAVFLGKEQTVVNMQIVCKYSPWWKPIMSGFMWFLFGWWLFRKGNALMAKNGGIK